MLETRPAIWQLRDIAGRLTVLYAEAMDSNQRIPQQVPAQSLYRVIEFVELSLSLSLYPSPSEFHGFEFLQTPFIRFWMKTLGKFEVARQAIAHS